MHINLEQNKIFISYLMNYRKNKNKKDNSVPFALNFSRELLNIDHIVRKRLKNHENSDHVKRAF